MPITKYKQRNYLFNKRSSIFKFGKAATGMVVAFSFEEEPIGKLSRPSGTQIRRNGGIFNNILPQI